MTRERWEQILFAHISDEVVQDMLNQYVLELESSNAKLRELVRELLPCYIWSDCYGKCVNEDSRWADCPKHNLQKIASELGVEVTIHDRS